MKKFQIELVFSILFFAFVLELQALNCTTPTGLNIVGVNSICAGSSTSLSVTASGVDINTQYTWNGPQGFSSNTASINNITLAGTYTCYVSNGIGCIDSVNTVVQLTPTVLPTITINTASNSVCSNVNLNYTSSITNGGTNPVYQWNRNGVPLAGANQSTLSILASTLLTNDIISCTLISSAVCASPSSINSNNEVMTINQVPNLVVNPSGGFVCSGSPSLTMTAIGAGTFSWTPSTGLNTTSSAQVTATPLVNTTYTVTGTSNGCSSSTNVTVNYNASGAASVQISASQTNICSGTAVTFTATPTGGGSTPLYQWKKNGVNINGATAYIYLSNTLNNNDVISCSMISNDPCVTNTNATSNSITMTVSSTSTPGVTITSSQTTICSGTNINFTAIPSFGGSNPTYYWKVNGVLASNSGQSFSTNSLSNQDTVTCTMISNQLCATNPVVTSNPIIVQVDVLSSPTIQISSNQSSSCSGTPVVFSSVITNGGSNPSYQWKKNGVNIIGETNSTYTSTTLANNDAITCELTSSSICANPQLASSNTIVASVTQTVNASVLVGSTVGTLICAGVPAMFLATPINGGNSPIYQWYLNGVVQAGQTSTVFSPSTINTNDSIRCVMTSNALCVSQTVVSSSTLEMTVLPNVTSSLSITSTNPNICRGTEVSFFAHAGAGITNPLFQWRVNGVNIPQAVDSIFSTKNLQNGDVVSALLFSSSECLSSNNLASNSITINVNQIDLGLNFSADTQVPTAQSFFKVNLINTTADTLNRVFTWYYGDGTSYTGATPQVHYYPNNGSYTVALLVYDALTTCTDSMSKKDFIFCSGGISCNQTINVTPIGNSINGCSGGNVILTCTTNASSPLYQWNKNGIPLGGETNHYFVASTNGSYSVTVYENGGCPKTSVAKYISFTNAPPAAPVITQSAALLSCTPDTVTLTASSGFSEYLWNNGSVGQTIQVTTSGVYAVIGKVNDGCNRQSDPLAINASSVAAPPICMVTVDTLTNKNLLIWEKPITTEIDSFVVFKETSPFVYRRIGAQPYSAFSEFIDFNSSPNQTSSVYKLVAVDNCGDLTLPSIFHRTIHLQITPGIANSRNLSWNNQLGFAYDSCQIYRGNGQSWNQIGVVSNQVNSFVDITNLNTTDTNYLITVKVPNGGCVSTKQNLIAKIKSTSNSSTNRNISVFASGYRDLPFSTISIFPNPSSDVITIQGLEYGKTNLEIYDCTFKRIKSVQIQGNDSKVQLQIDELFPGLYFIKVENMIIKFIRK